ncbi:uracil-DNA glycosylase [Oleiharenicola lentus]|uniref:uracil-DNA glycosylase n=1 Tax=Oleiharenicola lentus TaxID=2508720 RepID=UPI003F671E94
MSLSPLTLPPAWSGVFSGDYTREQFDSLITEIDRRYATEAVFPSKENVFRALHLVRPEEVKVIIVGQDPYPTPGNAHGLSFSVDASAKIPGSLKAIFQSLAHSHADWQPPASGDLQRWAAQGVLLLNAILTVRSGEPLSHAKLGWEKFTRAVLEHAQAKSPFIVFLLWGGKAATIADPVIDLTKHAALRDQHPSRLAQNRLPPEKKFAVNGHFTEANKLLVTHGRTPIDWHLHNDATSQLELG